MELAEKVAAFQGRSAIRRLELSRAGELLAELPAGDAPRWVVVGDDADRELDPACDAELPFARRLPEVCRDQEAVVLAWRPGRRMVVRLRRDGAPGGVAFVKALRAGRMRPALERHVEGLRAARAAGLGAAEVLAVEPPSAAFVLADLGAERVAVASASAHRFRLLGSGLARFQRVEGGASLDEHGIDAELEVLDVLSARVRHIRGHLPPGWEQARAPVADRLRAVGCGRQVRTHRDLHDRQLLAHGDGIALLDFDLLCVADEAVDPSNLLAHFELRALQGLATEQEAASCAAAFRAGFGRLEDAELERRLSAWGAATYLRLALVYYLRPPHEHLGTMLVERALACAGGARHGPA